MVSILYESLPFTGDDVVEFQAHGSNAFQAYPRSVIASGARLADPGEFTKNAFLSVARLHLKQKL